MTDDKGSVHDALRGAGSDSEHMERRLKPLSGFSGMSGEMRELAATISRDIYLHSPNVRWEDIIGLEDAKRLVKDAVVYPIKYPQVFTGILCPWKGLLLYGPPVGVSHIWKMRELKSSSSNGQRNQVLGRLAISLVKEISRFPIQEVSIQKTEPA